MRTITITTLILALAVLPAAQAQQKKQQRDPRQTLNKGAAVPQEVIDRYEDRNFNGMPYRFLAPENYDSFRAYPLILSLHGRAGIGNDNKSSLRHWLSIFVEDEWRAKYPCFLVAPQSEVSWLIKGETVPELTEAELAKYPDEWRSYLERHSGANAEPAGTLSKAFELVESLTGKYNIDKDRIYVLGHSMGGYGTWNAIWANPGMFAAAIPSAGGLPPWKDYAKFKDVPIWAFHGDNDPTVPPAFTHQIFDAMKELGGNMKFTEIHGVGHGASKEGFVYKGDAPGKGNVTHYSSDRCDKTPNVWDWLFKQNRKER